MSSYRVTIDRNAALNWKFAALFYEQFPLRPIIILSNQCNLSGQAYFDESGPKRLAS